MSGELVSRTGAELEPGNEEDSQPELNLERILDTLFHVKDRYGIDLEEEDLREMLGEDDNDFLGNLATLATMYDIDYEDFFIEIGVPAHYVFELREQLEITDGTE